MNLLLWKRPILKDEFPSLISVSLPDNIVLHQVAFIIGDSIESSTLNVNVLSSIVNRFNYKSLTGCNH